MDGSGIGAKSRVDRRGQGQGQEAGTECQARQTGKGLCWAVTRGSGWAWMEGKLLRGRKGSGRTLHPCPGCLPLRLSG